MVKVACVDIGGTSLKVGLVDDAGLGAVKAEKTRAPLTPSSLVDHLVAMLRPLQPFDGIGVGFPGVISGGAIRTANNLGDLSVWGGFSLGDALTERLGVEAAVANDADVAALGAARGEGIELTVTLGTGVGTGVTLDGVLQSHLELSQIPIGGEPTLDAYLGVEALKHLDEAAWDARCLEVLRLLDHVVTPDQIWLAGGNARRVTRSMLAELEERVWVLTEPVGLLGGATLFASKLHGAAG
jgi:polyphosphate glucokinase